MVERVKHEPDWWTTTSSAIHTGGQINRLELNCDGTSLEASINGVRVGAVSDPAFSSGQLWIGMGQSAPGVTPPPGTPPGATIEAHFADLVVTQQ